MAEVTGLTAEVAIEYEDVNMPRKLGKGRKMIGLEGTGSIKLNKVTSRFIALLSDNLKSGRQTTVTIISKLADPDALGAERIVVKDAILDGMTLANWEAKTKGEEEVNFGFSDWDLLDIIEA
ncbi:MAG: phage tail tube protein [Bacteroidales bacterium]|nr:phage tail tube protein [Bacteroidales bacterium]